MAAQRNRGPRGDLSAGLIVEAAERLLHEQGLRGLSLRRIAAAAGIAPNAIYTYLSGMEEIRNHLGDRFLATLDLTPLEGAPVAGSLSAFLRGVLDRFQASPAGAEVLAGQRIIGPHALALNEALLRFFDAAGLSPERSWAATGFLTEWVHGAAMLTASDAPTPSFTARAEAIDPAAFPLTAAMLGGWSQADPLDLISEALLAPG
jgi:AcrR family transcriptional regulator